MCKTLRTLSDAPKTIELVAVEEKYSVRLVKRAETRKNLMAVHGVRISKEEFEKSESLYCVGHEAKGVYIDANPLCFGFSHVEDASAASDGQLIPCAANSNFPQFLSYLLGMGLGAFVRDSAEMGKKANATVIFVEEEIIIRSSGVINANEFVYVDWKESGFRSKQWIIGQVSEEKKREEKRRNNLITVLNEQGLVLSKATESTIKNKWTTLQHESTFASPSPNNNSFPFTILLPINVKRKDPSLLLRFGAGPCGSPVLHFQVNLNKDVKVSKGRKNGVTLSMNENTFIFQSGESQAIVDSISKCIEELQDGNKGNS